LAQGDSTVKAKAICELFSENQFSNPNISSYNIKHDKFGNGPGELKSQEKQFGEVMLSRDQLNCIISIFVNISLVLLPIYSSDFPCRDKRVFYKFLVQWTKRS